MATILVIAGHGRNRNGSFDPGAMGYVTKGENRYYREDFFPAMRKYLPDGHNVVLFEEYNVFDYNNLATLAKNYGNDTVVVEMHFDATGSPAASGGHVIVHRDYEPDKLDLAIRDVIKKHIGVRYNHRGHQGISGRADLKNCNIARNNNVNYRLVELGFGTNKKDAEIMMNNVDAIAKDFVSALCGKVKEAPKVNQPIVKGAQVSNEGVIDMQGTFVANDTIIVRDQPTTKARHIATYKKGESLIYEAVHFKNGYVWLQYARAVGGKGYIPIAPLAEMWGTLK